MAKELKTLYPGQSDITAGFPNGAFKNDGTPGDKTGTPLEKEWQNDIWGFLSYLLNAAGITPSGSDEDITASQYYQALQALFLQGSGDIDLEGNYFLRSQTIQDLQPFPAAVFGGNSYVTVPDNINLNPGTQSFSIRRTFYYDGSTGSFQTIYDKRTGGRTYLGIDPAGKLNFLIQDSAVTTGAIFSDSALSIGWHTAVVRAEKGALMTMHLDGDLQVDTDSTPPLAINPGEDLRFGALSGAAAEYSNGADRGGETYNRHLTADEAKALSSNPLKAIDPADEGGSNVALTSGTLIISKRYRIDSYVAGDDFTNVGAASNVTGEVFTATGTTPTTWTNSSELRRLGATAVYKGRDLVVDSDGDVLFWKDSSGNGNHGAGTNVKASNLSESLDPREATFVAGLSAGSGTITLDSAVSDLSQVKSGGRVDIFGTIAVSSISSPSGTLRLTGLEFACRDRTDLSERSSFNITTNNLGLAKTGDLRAFIVAGEKAIKIVQNVNETSGPTDDFAGNIGASTSITISGFYYTDE